MDSKAKPNLPGKRYNVHKCPRHHDLAILLKSARKDICNTCFATLKKSYFNVIAGMLLEMHWLHDMTRRSVEQDNTLLQRLQEQEQAILNLQAEITDVKNNGRNHETPTPKPTDHTIPDPATKADLPPSKNASKTRPAGHVLQAAAALHDLLHLKIARIWQARKKTTSRNTPKTDDLQEGKGTTHAHGGFLMP